MSILLIYPQMLVTEKWVSLPYDTQSGFQNYTNICKAIMCIKIFPNTIFMITVNFCYCLYLRSESVLTQHNLADGEVLINLS